jgi:hypothetical protein
MFKRYKKFFLEKFGIKNTLIILPHILIVEKLNSIDEKL